MRTPLIRWAIYTSLGWLVVWMSASLVGFLLVEDSGELLLSSKWQTLLPAFGFVGLMIFGMNYHFIPVFSGRRLGVPPLAAVQIVVANHAILTILLSSVPGLQELEVLGFALWLASSILFLAVLVMTFRGPVVRPRNSQTAAKLGRLATLLTMATPAYLLASSVLLLWASVTASPPLPFAAGVHLYTFGFVTLMIYGVGLHLFPRFQKAEPSPVLAGALVVTAIPTPAGIAAFMFGHPVGFAAFAVLGAISGIAFLLVLLDIRARSPRPRRFYRLNLAAASVLVIGVGLGTLFTFVPGLRYLAPLHARINLLGFAGLMIMGVAHEALPPYAWRGYSTSLRAGDLHLVGILVVEGQENPDIFQP